MGCSTAGIKRSSAVMLSVLAVWTFPMLLQASDHCGGLPGCGQDKVALIRCEASIEGTIRVHSSSVTSATGVTVRKGDECAATVAALLKAGLKIWNGSRVTANYGRWTEFNFLFLGYDHDDRSDDDRDDDD